LFFLPLVVNKDFQKFCASGFRPLKKPASVKILLGPQKYWCGI